MGVGETLSSTKDVLSPAADIVAGPMARLMTHAWVLFPIIVIALIVGIVVIVKNIQKKKHQWTHKLRIRRVLPGGLIDDKNQEQKNKSPQQKLRLSEPIFIKMRRFPLIKKAEVFELETPLLGGYLFPELDEYSGDNEFSIILDSNNRIYTNKGEFFEPDKKCVLVTAKHSEIDIVRSNLKADFQNINKINKRVEWATIAKYAFLTIFIIAAMIVCLVGLTKWGEAKGEDAKKAASEAQAMSNLADAMLTMEGVVNTQKLEIIPMMKEVYKTKDLNSIIKTNYTGKV